MVYMDALTCKIEAPERKFCNLSMKTSACGRLLHPGSRHVVHRVPVSASFLLPRLLMPLPQASAAGRKGTLPHRKYRVLTG